MNVDEKIYELPDLFTNTNGINEVIQIILDEKISVESIEGQETSFSFTVGF